VLPQPTSCFTSKRKPDYCAVAVKIAPLVVRSLVLAAGAFPVSASGAGFPLCPTCKGSSGPDIASYLFVFAGIVLALRLIFWLLSAILHVGHKWRIAKDVKVLPALRTKAENGDVATQYKLGRMYEYGEGVNQDNLEARKWYGKAADQGHQGASFQISQMNVRIMTHR
jgi:TPR repeat protein